MGKSFGVHTEKVAGGKLVRIKVFPAENNKGIKKVQLLGDFFLHPEECVLEIESLLEKSASEEEEKIARSIESLLRERGARLIGVDAAAIARCFASALKNTGE